jgi:uncharacterized protein DUF992
MGKIITLALAAAALMSVSAHAANSGVKVGILNCDVDGGFGIILGSSKDVRCSYIPTAGNGERYTGNITKIGVDIGFTKGGILVWNVIAPASNVAPGALAGTYGGVTGSATFGVGLGANVLLGGLNKSIALQPVSVEGNTGLNVAAGIAELVLNKQN